MLCGSAVIAQPVTEKNTAAQRCPEIHMASLYIAQLTGMEPLDLCPPIIYHTDSPLAQGKVSDLVSLHSIGVGYYPETTAILLPISMDLNNPEDFSYLMHQVVHAYQFAYGIDHKVDCKRQLELQAFSVQAQYLRDNGLEDEASEMFLTAKYRGTCNRASVVN